MPSPDRVPATHLPEVFASGVLMGAADIVPGVSGGTVALLLGIYARLVGQIRLVVAGLAGVLRGDVRGAVQRLREVEWAWIITLVAGILTAVVVLASTIEHQLARNPTPMSGLFFGLVAGSTFVALGDVNRWGRVEVTATIAVAVVTFFVLGVKPATVADPSLIVFAGAGAIAICAMILPGISGSFLLLAMGMYEPLLDAANARRLLELAAFATGAAIGLASFSTLLSHLLFRWHDRLLAVLIGLMVGSVRVLWPWPAGDGVGDTRLGAPQGQVLVTVVLAVVGFVVVGAVAGLARRRLASVEARPAGGPAGNGGRSWPWTSR